MPNGRYLLTNVIGNQGFPQEPEQPTPITRPIYRTGRQELADVARASDGSIQGHPGYVRTPVIENGREVGEAVYRIGVGPDGRRLTYELVGEPGAPGPEFDRDRARANRTTKPCPTCGGSGRVPA